MRYINHYDWGLEYYCFQASELTSVLHFWTPQEVLRHLEEFSAAQQQRLCHTLQQGLRRLATSRYGLSGKLPVRIRNIGERQLWLTEQELLPVLEWVRDLHQKNQEARRSWLYALKEAAAQIGHPSAEHFLSAFPHLRTQRAGLRRENGSARLILPEALWGRMELKLLEIQEDEEHPIGDGVAGYLCWIEAEKLESGLEFRFLFDTETGNTTYAERLLQTNGWQEVRVRCASAQLETACFNYPERLRLEGRSGMNAWLLNMAELRKKQLFLGDHALSAEEQRLLPLAEFFANGELLTNCGLQPQTAEEIPFTNRFLTERVIRLLKEECGKPGALLGENLEAAQLLFDDEQWAKSDKEFRRFCWNLQRLEQNGEAGWITRPFLKRFRRALPEDGELPRFGIPYGRALAAARSVAEEVLSKAGFTGTYPHYYRHRGRKAEYITVFLGNEPTVLPNGQLAFPCVLTAAQCSEVRNGADRKGNSLPASEGSTAEIEPMKTGGHYGVIETDSSGNACLFSWDYAASFTDEELERRKHQLRDLLLMAEAGLRGKKLPRGFLRRHGESLRRERIFAGGVNRALPVGVLAAVTVLILGLRFPELADPGTVLSAALGGGGLLIVLSAALRSLWLKRSIWKK